MSRIRGYLCGVPQTYCNAPMKPYGGDPIGRKIHTTPEEARRCFIRELKRQGYIQLAQQEFQPPNGGPVIVLPRLRKFGQMVVAGKPGEIGGSSKRLNIPRHQAGIYEVIP